MEPAIPQHPLWLNISVMSRLRDSAVKLSRAVPAPLVPTLVSLLSWIKRRDPARRASARDQMLFVVGNEVTKAELDDLVDAYISRSIWRSVSRWHPRLITRQELEGVEHLKSVSASDGGFLLCITHHGDWEGIWASLSRIGFRCRIVATPDILRDDAPSWLKQQRRIIEMGGSTMVDVRVGTQGVKELVAHGDVVCIASDIPGRTPVRFLGHDLLCASGVARVATDCNLPVVLVTSHRQPDQPNKCGVLRLNPPFHPKEFKNAEDLLQSLFACQERSWLEWPEAADDPRRIVNRDRVARWKQGRAPADG